MLEPKGEPETKEFDPSALTEEQITAIKEKFHFKDDKDVDKIIKSKRARWAKEKEEAEKEVARLASLSAEEKLQEQLEVAQKKIAEFEHADRMRAMANEVTKQLQDAHIDSTPEMVNMLVRDTAEETAKAIEAYKASVASMQSAWEKARNAGKPPVTSQTNLDGKQLPTKQEILQMTYAQHVRFKREHPDEYKEIMK